MGISLSFFLLLAASIIYGDKIKLDEHEKTVLKMSKIDKGLTLAMEVSSLDSATRLTAFAFASNPLLLYS